MLWTTPGIEDHQVLRAKLGDLLGEGRDWWKWDLEGLWDSVILTVGKVHKAVESFHIDLGRFDYFVFCLFERAFEKYPEDRRLPGDGVGVGPDFMFFRPHDEGD